MISTLRSHFFLALSALIVLLGFGGCKSSKKAQRETGTEKKVSQGDPSRIRVLYGARPPINYTPSEDE